MTAEDPIPAAGDPSVVPARHWQRLDDGRLQCDVCPRFCRLAEGQRGLCFVRANQGGRMVLTTYGRSSGFCVDPIEKKPLYHFLPGTPVLSFGTAGCNLACSFCQNWDISKSRQTDTLADAASPAAIARTAARFGCRSVAFTYNDPVVFLEYAVDAAAACRAHGLRSVAVTAGYMTAPARAEFYRHMDAANVDLKAFSEAFYRRVTKSRLGPVLDTLEYIRKETRCWLEITTLLIPGENDGQDELERMCAWIAERLGPDVPIHFSAFHPDYRMQDKPRTPHTTLSTARRIAVAAGLRYAYVGNVHDPARDSTWCHACGEKVIGRDWYKLDRWHLDGDGACLACGTPVAGLFDGPPGDWGSKRRRVRIAT